jgi:hypothetical protein
MNTLQTVIFATLLSLPILGCSKTPEVTEVSKATEEAKGLIETHIDQALNQARKKLHEENLTISSSHGVIVNGKSVNPATKGLPEAAITPTGDLLVNGKPLDITTEQREQLLAYRQQILSIADAGIAIGSQGAGLASTAIGGVMGVIFGGEKAQQAFEEKMEAEGKKLEDEAKKICTRLPALLTQQHALAQSLPAFAPYATMTQKDIDDCMK